VFTWEGSRPTKSGIASVLTCEVVVVVGGVVVVVVVVVVVPGAVVVVWTVVVVCAVVVVTAVVVVVVPVAPEEVSRINAEPVGTALGFFVVPESQPATRPVAMVELGMLADVGQVAVTCTAVNAVVAAVQVLPRRVGNVTGAAARPLETVTARAEPPATLEPAVGV